MDFSEALFPVEPNIVLSPDPSMWSDTIVDHLVEKYPALSSFVGEVIYTRIDKIEGNAVGVITLVDRPQKIPFIIDSRNLDSLDVYIDGETYLPLNQETSEKIVSRLWPFKLVPETDRRTITKTAASLSVISHVPEKFINEHKDIFIKIAEENPEFLENINIEPKPDSISENTVLNVFIKSASCDAPIVVKDFKNKKEESYTMKKFAEIHGKDTLLNIIASDNVYLTNFNPFNNLNFENTRSFEKNASTSNENIHIDYNGKVVYGKLFDLHSIDPEHKTNSKIFITTDGSPKYLIGSSFKAYKNEYMAESDIKGISPKVGDSAVILKDNCAYGPFQIKAIEVRNSEKVYIVEQNFDKYVIKPVFGIKKMILEGNTLLIPAGSFISKIDQLDSYNSEIAKIASVNVSVSKLTNGNYRIMDGGVSGISASDLKEVQKGDAIATLMHCGLPEKEAQYALQKAQSSGVYSFNASTQVENSELSKKAEDDNLEKISDEIKALASKGEIFKFAAFNDKSNLDEALALNLVTSSTVKKFALLIPSISSTINSLCKFLMTKRLNKQLITADENDIKKAISSLYKINLSLGSL